MQEGQLKLKEIIWEMTGRCENHCSYCGSKETWNCVVDEDMILKISQAISKYAPEEIDMSGGDPLLVSHETHKKILDLLHEKNVKCKILLNPKSVFKGQERLRTALLYDWIGISVNEAEELKLLSGYGIGNFFKKSTIISNFNLQNIFLYEEIEEFVKKHNLMWQVQYTMYKDDNPLAIYKNDPAIKALSEKVSKSILGGMKVLVADNANHGRCGAGISSIGILCNGDVVPCLSMRSWVENINSVVVGNLISEEWKENSDEIAYNKFLENPLKYIWENRFDKYRFESFKCCKDHVGNKCVTTTACLKEKEISFYDLLDEESKKPITKRRKFPGRVIMYGATPDYDEPATYVYAVGREMTVSVYAVQTSKSLDDLENLKTHSITYVLPNDSGSGVTDQGG